VGIVRSRTQATEFSSFFYVFKQFYRIIFDEVRTRDFTDIQRNYRIPLFSANPVVGDISMVIQLANKELPLKPP
jgi:hypothetical protein